MHMRGRWFMKSVVGVMWVTGMAFLIKAVWHWQHAIIAEKATKGIDEKLKESKAALDKAFTYAQSVFDRIKSRVQ
jgi:hypothetical protein